VTGNEVEVWVSLGTGWTAGFEVVAVEQSDSGEELYRLRRQSDGAEIPVALAADRVRPVDSAPRSWQQ
jgi:hypothetical protein